MAGVGFVSGDIGVSTLRIFVAKSLRQVESARRDAARPSGPSGGAHAPPTIASAAACRAVVDGLAPPPDPPAIQDPIALIHTNTYAPLPLETVPQEVTQFNSYFTADMYLDGTPVPDPTVWRNAMNADHFVDAIAAGYRNSNGATFGAEAFKFGSAAMAADFQRQTLDAACNGGHASRMASIDRLPGAVVYESTDSGVSPYRASAVVGPYVLHFYLCGCVGGHDLLGRARLWARSAASEIGVTPS